MKQLIPDKTLDELTLGEIRDLVDEAYYEGWESDDNFSLAININIIENKSKRKWK